jgi:hypothetical protein
MWGDPGWVTFVSQLASFARVRAVLDAAQSVA